MKKYIILRSRQPQLDENVFESKHSLTEEEDSCMKSCAKLWECNEVFLQGALLGMSIITVIMLILQAVLILDKLGANFLHESFSWLFTLFPFITILISFTLCIMCSLFAKDSSKKSKRSTDLDDGECPHWLTKLILMIFSSSTSVILALLGLQWDESLNFMRGTTLLLACAIPFGVSFVISIFYFLFICVEGDHYNTVM